MANQTGTGGHSVSNMTVSDNARVDVGDKTYNINTIDADLTILERLQPVKNAKWDSFDESPDNVGSTPGTTRSHQFCHPDTRVEVLHQIQTWASDSNECIFWLAGMAGTGKSTIAMSVCQTLDDSGWTVASFFFRKRRSDGLAAVHKVIPTLSYQLATQDSRFREAVAQIIRTKPDKVEGGGMNMAKHMKHLLVEPLLNLAEFADCKRPQILVIDAMDECDDDKMMHSLLKLLGSVKSSHGVKIKIFLTSRRDWRIVPFFLEDPNVFIRELLLHNVERAIVDQDIGRYLQSKLETLAKDRSIKQPWPEPRHVKELVDLSAGLFIFAATSVRFVRGNSHNTLIPHAKRLAKVCQRSHWKGKNKATEELDQMYSLVISEAFIESDFEADEKDEVKEAWLRILEVLVLTFASVSMSTISALTKIDAGTVANVLQSLHAVVGVSRNDDVWILHESFGDFLLDEDRCTGPPKMFIPRESGHRQLLSYCLKTMAELLKENICQLETTGSGLRTLAERKINTGIPPELQYACLHWHRHFLVSGMSTETWAVVHDFLNSHALKYLEAMAILQKLSECVLLLADLESRASEQANVRGIIYDLRRFILTYRTGIEQAPLQVYLLAAHFAPTETVMRSFANETAKRYWIKTQPAKRWSSFVLSVKIAEGLRIIDAVFSWDGSRLAVVLKRLGVRNGPADLDDCTFSVIETSTGGMLELCQETLAREAEFASLSLTDDGSFLGFSDRDWTTKVFDTITTICVFHANDHKLEGFSKDGSTLITRYSKIHDVSDSTLMAWETATGALRYRLPGSGVQVLALGATKIVIGPEEHQNSIDVLVHDIKSCDLCFTSLDPANTCPIPAPGCVNQVKLSECEDILLVALSSDTDDGDHGDNVYSCDLVRGVWSHLPSDRNPETQPLPSHFHRVVHDTHIRGKGPDVEIELLSAIEQKCDDQYWMHPGTRYPPRSWTVDTFNTATSSSLLRTQSLILEQGPPLNHPDDYLEGQGNLVGNGRYFCLVHEYVHYSLLETFGLSSDNVLACQTLPIEAGSPIVRYCSLKPMAAIDKGYGSAMEVHDVSGPVQHEKYDATVSVGKAVSPDGTLSATIGPGDILRLWSVGNGTCSQQSTADALCKHLRRDSEDISMAIASDNSMIAILVMLRGEVGRMECWLWDRRSEPRLLTRHSSKECFQRLAIRFSPDGLEIWFRGQSYMPRYFPWQRLCAIEETLLETSNSKCGAIRWPGKSEGIEYTLSHPVIGALYLVGQWVIEADENFRFVPEEARATGGCPLVWIPDEYRPRPHQPDLPDQSDLWSGSLQTLILHSEAGNVTFVKLNK